ncbi:MAG: hypothetical protein ACREQ5_40570 [Candidatus Dormibacteria bacterium]
MFEANRNKISVSGLDQVNFMYRWVNDVEDRLVMFLEGGWTFVDAKGKQVGEGQGVDEVKSSGSSLSRNMGRGVIAFLMKIPKALWDEDQKLKAKEEITIVSNKLKSLSNENADYGKVTIEVKGSQ